jgi:ABC-2 type transport system permease protein
VSFRRATRLVARREFGERIRTRALQISTLVTVLIVAAIAIAAGVFGDEGPEEFTVAAQGAEAVSIAEAARATGRSFDARIDVRRFTGGTQARAAARNGDVDAAIVGEEILSDGALAPELEGALQAAARQVRATAALREEGVEPNAAQRALAPPALHVRTLGTADDGRRGIAFLASLLLYLQLIVFGLAVASGVVEEKSSRIVEILLAAVPGRALLAGKVFGIGVVGLLQLALVALVGLVTASLSGAIELDSDHAGVLAVVLVWFVLGYVLYAALYAVAGVIVSRQEDMNSSSTPVTMILVAGYLIAFPVLEDPDGSLAVFTSLLPLTSPIVMPVRAVMGDAGATEIAASVGLLVLAIALLIPLAARIYEGSVLRMGKPLRLREALRTARATR